MSSDRRISFAIHFINEQCRVRSLRLRDVATKVRLSPWHFDRLLKSATGASFKAHLRAARLGAAPQMLEEGFLTMKEIAAALGYARTSHFDRDFKSIHGVTPTQWRGRAVDKGLDQR
jgi:AraC-like DNA-binding protein